MKKLIAMVVMLCFVGGGALLAFAADAPETLTLTPKKMAPVTFAHKVHADKLGDCLKCHHNGIEKPKCTECHGVDAKILKSKEAFHKLCIDCHKAEKVAAVKCAECHIKPKG